MTADSDQTPAEYAAAALLNASRADLLGTGLFRSYRPVDYAKARLKLPRGKGGPVMVEALVALGGDRDTLLRALPSKPKPPPRKRKPKPAPARPAPEPETEPEQYPTTDSRRQVEKEPGPPPTPEENPGRALAVARARETLAKADLAELNAAARAGELVPAGQVEAGLHQSGIALRRSFDSLARDLHGKVPADLRDWVRDRLERERETLQASQSRAFGKHLGSGG